MGDVNFYHLTQRSVDSAIAPLLQKSQQVGWRVVVRSVTSDFADWLDDRLWQQGADHEFAPHGRAGGPHDDMQPVLLCEDDTTVADCIMLVEGAQIDLAQAQAASRVCVLFQADNDAHMNSARQLWIQLAGQGVALKYFSEETGAWALKMEKPALG